MQMKMEQRLMRSISLRSRLAAAVFFGFMFLLLLCGKELIEDEEAVGNTKARPPLSKKVIIPEKKNSTASVAAALPTTRTLPQQQSSGDDGGDANRIGTGCSRDDIAIYQGQTAPLPNGIPSYTVEILNSCTSGCSIADIHVNCGWFSSARLVNPRVFRRLLYDDCLVNNGEPLGPGQTLSFQYANSFAYPFSVSSAHCLN